MHTIERTQDLHVIETVPLISPAQLKQELPISEKAAHVVVESRNVIKRMLRDKDQRLLVITGPCSIHNEQLAYDYAERLVRLHNDLKDRLFIVMRVYFEKPRTTVGWKGLINDPHLDGSFDMEHGLQKAREILLRINDLGLPAATEFLDPIVPQYFDDLITWAAIGARTTESQTHRQMASGLSMPVGFKNNTEGNLQIAVDALHSCGAPHSFLGINQDGVTALVKTSGNVWGHIILRGGRTGPNYDRESIHQTIDLLNKAKTRLNIMVDCSHANSNKDYTKQEVVLKDIVAQRVEHNEPIFGVMLESNIHSGNQDIPEDLSQLKYGVSVTDGCIDWETTERILREAYEKLG